jgi:hypothetical protein
MKVIRHDNKLMQRIFPLIAIAEQYLDQEPRSRFDTKDRLAPPTNACDEKRTQ